MDHSGIAIAQGSGLHQWFVQQYITYAILKSSLRHDRPKVAPAKARPGVKSSMLGRSHARAATDFALMNSEPKTHEYDAPADPGEKHLLLRYIHVQAGNHAPTVQLHSRKVHHLAMHSCC